MDRNVSGLTSRQPTYTYGATTGAQDIRDPQWTKSELNNYSAPGDESESRKLSRTYPKKDEMQRLLPDETNDITSSSNFSWGSAKESRYRSSAAEEFCFETTLKGGFVLKVYNASITRVKVDAIVNAANDVMAHGGGVARVISDASGYSLDEECRLYVKKYGPVEISKNIVTTAGRLPYKAVIHAVGPEWHEYRNKVTCLDDLFDCVYNILDTCRKNRFRTVAMTAISAGIFGVPRCLCADMYVYAAAHFSNTLLPSEYPKELHIIDVDIRVLQFVEESVKRWRTNSESLNQRLTIPKFLKENPHLASFSNYKTDSNWQQAGNRYTSNSEGQRHTRSGEGQRYTQSSVGQHNYPTSEDQRNTSNSRSQHYTPIGGGQRYTTSSVGQRYDSSTEGRFSDPRSGDQQYTPIGDGQRYNTGRESPRNIPSSNGQQFMSSTEGWRYTSDSKGQQYTQSGVDQRYTTKRDTQRYKSEASGSLLSNGIKSRNKNDTSHELASNVARIRDQKFTWGGIAKQFVVGKQITVKIYQGDISKVRNMDAIVCGIGKDLQLNGSIANALKDAGGIVYVKSCQRMKEKHRHAELSDTFKCEGGNIGAKYVLHVVVKKIVEADTRDIEVYQDCMASILQKAKKNEWRKLAIPMIGTGTIRTNKRKMRLCGSALLKALDEFIVIHGDKHDLNEIHLVDSNMDVSDVLKEVFDYAADFQPSSTTDSSRFTSPSTGHFLASSASNGRGNASGYSYKYKDEGENFSDQRVSSRMQADRRTGTRKPNKPSSSTGNLMIIEN